MSGANLRVLVVWEPILATDWSPPSRFTLGRITDSRVIQFWDREHLVSAELRRSVEAHGAVTQPACCVDKGFYWDVALLFPPRQRWNNLLPIPIFWDGPVVRTAPALGKSLETALASPLASLLSKKNLIYAIIRR